MPKAILHIGVEKTGTSTIQRTLLRNKLTLQNRGFYFPVPHQGNRHLELPAVAQELNRQTGPRSNLGLESRKDLDQFRKYYFDELGNYISNIPESAHVIFSSEHCHSGLQTELEVSRLKTFLDPLFSQYQIVLYLRRQDEMLLSFLSTLLRAGGTPDQILPSPRVDNTYANFDKLLNMWEGVFGIEKITPRLFDKSEFVNGNLLDDFFSTIGFPSPEDLEHFRDRNQTLSSSVQRFLRHFNLALKQRQENQTWQARRGPIAQRIEHFGDDKGLRPARADAENFAKSFAESNERIRDRYFPNKNTLFSEDFSMYPEAEDTFDLSSEECIQVSLELWKQSTKEEDRLHSLIWLRRAQRDKAQGDKENAINSLQYAVQYNSLNAPAQAQLAKLLHQRGDLSDALAAINNALSIEPSNKSWAKTKNQIESTLTRVKQHPRH